MTYTDAMRLVQGSDGLLVLGVDDAGYVPSKLFTYAQTGLPLLASFRHDSPAIGAFADAGGPGDLLSFGSESTVTDQHRHAMRRFLASVQRRDRESRDESLAPYMAPAMAARHARLFESVLASYSSEPKR